MNTQQLENLQALIKSSPILSSQERQEWNTLLDLMDDKQLNELQKILSTARPAPAVIVQPPKLPTPKPVSLPDLNEKLLSGHAEPQTQTKPEQSAISSKIPKLSHIVNLPKSFGPEAVKPVLNKAVVAESKPKTAQEILGLNKPVEQPIKAITPTSLTPPVLPAQKKENKFLSKLKSILAEKELPPGKPQDALPKPVLKPFVKLEVKKGPEIPQPKAEIKTAPALALTKAPISKIGSETSVLQKPQTEVKNVNPVGGLEAFSQSTQKEKENIISELKEHLESKSSEVKSQPGLPSNIEQLEDLTNFSVKNLNESDFQSIVKKIRILISKSGYHTVLFNLEQSSVFKAYLKTGFEILNNQATFEQMQLKTGSDYLNRRSFEAFADLLRQIQVG